MTSQNFAQRVGWPICLGILFFWFVFPLHILNPLNVDWIFHKPSLTYLGIDLHPYYLGWQFFRDAPWSFPIGSINDFVYPLNTYLAYTDSIPILALLLKPFSNLLPADFQYLGIWVLVCCILQNFFTFRLLNRWIKDPICLILATVLIAWSPVIVWRANHVALLSQWTLLWSLDLVAQRHLKKTSNDDASCSLWPPVLLLALTTAIQPYLAAMTLGICWTLPLSDFLRNKRLGSISTIKNWLMLAAQSFALTIPVLLILYIFGFMNGESKGEGFHWFASDLLGFLNNHFTSSIIPSFRRKAGLHEGYAWPGLGVWFLAGFIIFNLYKKKFALPPKNDLMRALLIATGFMFFFALGERIFIGTFWIIDMEWLWSTISFATKSFRSCGRFIWPLYYVLGFLCMCIIYTTQPLLHARKLLLVAIALQAIDMGPWYLNHSRRFPLGNRMEFSTNLWEREIVGAKHIRLIPPSIESGPCERKPQDHWYEWPEFANLAAKNNLTINSGYLARYDQSATKDLCDSHVIDFIEKPLAEDVLYIIRKGYEDKIPLERADRVCHSIDNFVTCKAKLGT